MERIKAVSKIAFFGATDVGLVRKSNQDVWYGDAAQKIFLVADGMGGHRAGEVAAETAMQNTISYLNKHRNKSSEIVVEEAISFANRKVYELSLTKPEYEGMGTTLCVLAFFDQEVVIAHVGDSRIYRFRKKLERLTEDHSLVQELLNMEGDNLENKNYFPIKNVLTRAIGTYPMVEPDINYFNFELGDLYLLCSDGLTNYVTDEQITKILSRKEALSVSGEGLIRLAKQQGGGDNVTVVLVQVNSI